MKIFFKALSAVSAVSVCILFTICAIEYNKLPERVSIFQGENIEFAKGLPITIESGDNVRAVSADQAQAVDMNYQVQAKLGGVIPIKDIQVNVVEKREVILCGTPFGIKIFTDGVMIVGISPISTKTGSKNPALDAGLEPGDIIEKVNGEEVYSNETVAKMIEQSQGKSLKFTVKRENNAVHVDFCAVRADDGTYKAGMWIRDSSAGIGTMTYIDPKTGAFGGLGHGICDIDTGKIVPLSNGEIVGVALTGVSKGSAGNPGELRGYLATDTVGELKINGELGVYGTVLQSGYSSTAYPVALKQEVREGAAQIIATLPNCEPDFYDIEIDKINYDESSKSKNLVVKITDEKLLDMTGGIVQGMSGSPIIQNGKFIGAVTHVFVNDPKLGYGIFAENMLENSDGLAETAQDKAS